MTDHPTPADMANLHERTAAFWREQAEALAGALGGMVRFADAVRVTMSVGKTQRERIEAAREALSRFNAAKGGVK